MESGISGESRFSVVEGKENDVKIELKFAHEFTTGKGLSKSLDSILMRPFRKVIENGSDLGKIYQLFFRQNNTDFIFGALTLTDKRLLFFPPMSKHLIQEDISDIRITNLNLETELDHVSLEQNLAKWHYSFKDKNIKNTKTDTQRTISLDKGFFLWFVWRFKSVQNLEVLPERHEFYLTGNHKPEVMRRAKIMLDAINSHNHTMLINDDPLTEDYFWNVEFFVSTDKDAELPPFPSYACHDRASIVRDTRGIVDGHGINKVYLDSFQGSIWIRIDKVIGELQADHTFISPSQNYVQLMKEADKKDTILG